MLGDYLKVPNERAKMSASPIAKLFTDHPASVDETYAQHLGVALGFAGWLFLAAIAALVHALIPGLFVKTASRIIDALHARMCNRA